MSDNPFEKVLDRLRAKGWYKGGFGDREGPNCIVGAHMTLPLSSRHRFLDFKKTITSILLAQYPERKEGKFELIANFNDHPDTTFADVERVLEKAAVKWEEERVLRDD